MSQEPHNTSFGPPTPQPAGQMEVPATCASTKPSIPCSDEPQSDASEPAPPGTQSSTVRRPRGKIARLSKPTRDKINFMLRDGLKYDDILSNLGDETKGITARNLSNWHTSPAYQHWLLQQDWLESLRDEQESAFDLLNDFDAAKFNQAALQLAVTRLFLALRNLEVGGLNDKLGGNARSFAGLVHALARACHENTNIEKYRDACSKAVAAQLKQLNLDRDLSDSEYQLLVNKMDQVFKMPRRSAPASRPTLPKNGSPLLPTAAIKSA